MIAGIEALLAELEADPKRTELVDVTQLLEVVGFRRFDGELAVVYYLPEARLTYNFPRSRQYLSEEYVLKIVRDIRAHLNL